MADFGKRTDKPSAEIDKLLKMNITDNSVINELKSKYNDENKVHSIYEQYKIHLENIKRVANKFKTLIHEKYHGSNVEISEIFKNKAPKFKEKYSLSDAEYDLFIKFIFADPEYKNYSLYNVPISKLSKTLGYASTGFTDGKLNYSQQESDELQQILKLHADTAMLHNAVVVQSFKHRQNPGNPRLLYNTYDHRKHSPYTFIHPVLAAMFLPSINYFDEHMLYASITNIVKRKHERLPINTKPDYELCWDLVTDPNEITCVGLTDQPVADLLKRALVQTRLWENVLSLRAGQYYLPTSHLFLAFLDQCNSNIFDAPDFAYVRDEGTIFRKILGVFSMRPTIVMTQSVSVSNMPTIAVTRSNLVPSAYQLTSVPMINIRIPFKIAPDTTTATTGITLKHSMSQIQWYVENNIILPKSQQILNSRDVIMFYIPRRFKSVRHGLFNKAFSFTDLPMTVSGFDNVNETEVLLDGYEMEIMGHIYDLASAVVVNKGKSLGSHIVGSSAIIRCDDSGLGFSDAWLDYDPLEAATSTEIKNPNETDLDQIKFKSESAIRNYTNESLLIDRLQKQATILIYRKRHPHHEIIN